MTHPEPVHVPPRFLPIDGSINFRDFGGYYTTDGRQIRWRKLFRCGSLGLMSEVGQQAFGDLRISVICDLRREDEALTSPTPLHPPFDVRRHIPIAPGSSPMLRSSLEDERQSAADRVRFMTDITREIARDNHAAYAELFGCLLTAEAGFLLHCSAGKDRTGFGAALILAALGVDEDIILEDYLLTNEAECLKAFFSERMKDSYGPHVDAASIEAVSGVRPEYLQAALEEVRLRHGSLLGYLDEIGINQAARAELKARYLL